MEDCSHRAAFGGIASPATPVVAILLPGVYGVQATSRSAAVKGRTCSLRLSKGDVLMLHAMIMAGGGGTRFWPRSRARRPKQFLTLTGDRSLIQTALDRIEAPVPPERCWVITGAAHRDETAAQLPTLPAGHIVGEPCGPDTAA